MKHLRRNQTIGLLLGFAFLAGCAVSALLWWALTEGPVDSRMIGTSIGLQVPRDAAIDAEEILVPMFKPGDGRTVTSGGDRWTSSAMSTAHRSWEDRPSTPYRCGKPARNAA